MAEVSQSKIESILARFLLTLGDESLAQPLYLQGLCNAWAFANFRADQIGEIHNNAKRMESLMEQDEKTITKLAKSYQEYKDHYRSLVEMKGGEDDLATTNRRLDQLYSDLKASHEKKEEKKAQEDIQNQIRIERAKREGFIEERLTKDLDKKTYEDAQIAKDIYIHIHQLVGSFVPGLDYGYNVDDKKESQSDTFDSGLEGKRVNQQDWVEMLQLFPPDTMIAKDSKGEEVKTNVKNVFEIAFNFTEEELVKLFSNSLGNVFREGDSINLSTSDHITYLSFKDGKFHLYDPGLVEIQPNNPEQLVKTIKERFFSADANVDYMPIAISIFAKIGAEEEKNPRPTRTEVITKLKERWSKDVDARAWDDSTALLMAASYGHVDVMQMLIEEGADIDAADNSGVTPLLVASQGGYVEAVQLLIEKKAGLEEQNAEGQTALLLAAGLGYTAIVKKLIDERIDIDTFGSKGVSAIYMAAQNGHYEIVDLLIQNNANVNIASREIWPPLSMAAQNGHVKIIKRLADAKARLDRLNSDGDTPAIIAIKHNRTAVIETLAECKADLNEPDFFKSTPLQHAIKQNNITIVNMLLDHGVRLNHRDREGRTALHHAIKIQNSEMVKKLLEQQARFDIKDQEGKSALHYAIEAKNIEIMELLLEKGAFDKPKKDTPFKKRNEMVVNEKLAMEFALDNIKDSKDMKSIEVFNRLVMQGGRLNLDFEKIVLLFDIADNEKFKSRSLELIRNIVICYSDTGMPTRASDIKGTQTLITSIQTPIPEHANVTPMMYLCSKKAETLQNLYNFDESILDAKALAVKNDKGQNFLHFAARNTDPAVLKFILSKANFTISEISTSDNSGKTPLIFAIERGNHETALTLLEYKPEKPPEQKYSFYSGVGFWLKQKNKPGKQEEKKEEIMVNKLDSENNSPLHYAAKHANLEMVTTLLKYKADPNVKNKDEKTPLAMTTNPEITALLLKHSAIQEKRSPSAGK